MPPPCVCEQGQRTLPAPIPELPGPVFLDFVPRPGPGPKRAQIGSMDTVLGQKSVTTRQKGSPHIARVNSVHLSMNGEGGPPRRPSRSRRAPFMMILGRFGPALVLPWAHFGRAGPGPFGRAEAHCRREAAF